MEPTPPGPTPIPVEGDVQVFADPECTRYPSGEVDMVYVRINVPWGYNDSWYVSDDDEVILFSAGAPGPSLPDELYTIWVWEQFLADSSVAYTAGQIVPVPSQTGSSVDVSTYQFVFTRP